MREKIITFSLKKNMRVRDEYNFCKTKKTIRKGHKKYLNKYLI